MTGSPRVLVIGAGMAGLAAAWRLHRAGASVTVLEQDDRVGGRIRSGLVDTQPVELGADFLTNYYPNALRLAADVGLEVADDPAPRRGGVPRDGRMFPVTPASHLVTTGLVPWRSKLRLGRAAWTLLRNWPRLDHHAMWRADILDRRSTAAYARAVLDDDLLEYVITPTLHGFLYWEPEETTQAMLFILLKGAIGVRRLRPSGEGVSALPARLAARLDVRLGTGVEEVTRHAGGGYEVRTTGGTLPADGIVCATTADVVPRIVGFLTDGQRAFFERVRYSTTIAVALACPSAGLTPYDGVLMPRREALHLAAATQRRGSPDLLVLYATGDGARSLRDASDAEVALALMADLHKAVPAFDPGLSPGGAAVRRWPRALPLFDVGHLRALRRFARGEYESGPLVFAGDYLGGPFVEGAVTSGMAAAGRLLGRLGERE